MWKLDTNFRLYPISVSVTRRQSMKFAYAVGAYTTIGGVFRTFSFAYQYLWGAGL